MGVVRNRVVVPDPSDAQVPQEITAPPSESGSIENEDIEPIILRRRRVRTKSEKQLPQISVNIKSNSGKRKFRRHANEKTLQVRHISLAKKYFR